MTQTVLLTGATGFLGSHLAKKLLEKGYRVAIFKRSFSDIKRIESIISDLIIYNLDECELDLPFKELNSIDFVIHTATCYGRGKEKPSEILDANICLPLKLLEILASMKQKAFLNTDSFFNTDTILYRYLNYYALSKKHFLEWGRQLSNSKNVRFVNIKLEHMFGHQDDLSKFTTQVITNCIHNVPSMNLTLGEQKRDFIHIDDVVSAYCVLLKEVTKKSELFQEYELGAGNSVSIRYFVETVKELANSSMKLNFGALPYRDHEIMESQANISALNALGWNPQHSLEKRLTQTINWYKQDHTYTV